VEEDTRFPAGDERRHGRTDTLLCLFQLTHPSSYTRGIYTQRTHARHARPLHWPLTARATRPTCMLAQLLDPHTPAARTTRSNAHNASLQQIAIRWTHYGQTRLGHVQPTRTNALVVDRHRMAWLMANTSHNARKI
jgi:hypothetical protein